MLEVRSHGGARQGAGRPKRYRRDVPHRGRPVLDERHPVHVVLRVMPYVTELRTRGFYRAVRKTMERYLGLAEFRIVHMSIQNTHLHLVVEASDRAALTRHMQSFAINCARAINRARDNTGKVFAYRYHATQVRDRCQAWNVVSYVLNNWRRHNADVINGSVSSYPVDPYSSGMTFVGWKARLQFPLPADYVPLPTSPPRTHLLVDVRNLDHLATPALFRR
jgi:REP element-mobilizing transposase RayT